jgi:hypothetical protein
VCVPFNRNSGANKQKSLQSVRTIICYRADPGDDATGQSEDIVHSLDHSLDLLASLCKIHLIDTSGIAVEEDEDEWPVRPA